jgi:hypothetical protein
MHALNYDRLYVAMVTVREGEERPLAARVRAVLLEGSSVYPAV